MNKKLFKQALVFLTLLVLVTPVVVLAAGSDPFGTAKLDNLTVKNETDVPNIVVNLINLVF